MGRRSDHSREQLLQMALEAAETLVDDGGWESVTVRAIAVQMGYTHGTLYQLVENLDDLLTRVSSRTLGAMIQALEIARERTPPGVGQVRAVAQAYVDFAQRCPNRWRLVFEHEPRRPGPNDHTIDEQIAQGFALIERALLGARPPRLEAHVEPPLPELAKALWTAVHGIAVLALKHKLVGEGMAPATIPSSRLVALTTTAFVGMLERD